VFALTKTIEPLDMTLDDIEFLYTFSMQQHCFLAIAMNKLDANLEKCRAELVPNVLEDTEFWMYYFYKIETIKASVGLPTSLGQRVERRMAAPAAEDDEARSEELDKDSEPADTQDSVNVSVDDYNKFLAFQKQQSAEQSVELSAEKK